MRQLKERITHSFTLGPLPARDVNDYVNFRLRQAGYHGPDLFGPEALRIIAEASEGLTRRINIYADKTLLAAFAAGTHTVSPDHARAAVMDTQVIMTRRESPRRMATVAIAGLAVGVAIGFALAQVVATRPGTSSTVAAAPASVPAATSPAATATGAVAATQPVAAKPAETPARPADIVAARAAAGRELLADETPNRHAVQLMLTDARSRAYLESYLAEAGRALEPDRLFLAPSGSAESPRFGVLYGTFKDRNEAIAALEALPPQLRQFKPYVRPLEALREEARRSERR
jgi:septal ring-binding cell division protein DamX